MSYADMIRRSAAKYGIDPNIALKVANTEGGTKGWVQSGVRKNGVREPSYGPFQMLVGGAGTGFPEGMGNQMMRETGLDPRDPRNAQPAIDFAMKQASVDGWRQWYGAKNNGIGRFDGIGGRGMTLTNSAPSPQQQATARSIVDAAVGQKPVTVGSGQPAPALSEGGMLGALAGVKADPVMDSNYFPEAPQLSAMQHLKNGDVGDAFKAATGNKDVTNGLQGLLAGLGGGSAQQAADQEAARIDPSSVGASFEASQAQRMQGAQQLMSQIMASKKQKPAGLSLMG